MSSIPDIFEKATSFLSVAAPMVRYSKLPFRATCRDFGVDITYTPMIMADCFVASKKARDNDFQFVKEDSPLVVQFGANDDITFGKASQLVAGYCSAVNLNCGCPQKWAIEEGIGASMLTKPQLIYDCVKSVRNMTNDRLACSVKIRINDDVKKTIDLAQQIEKTGAKYSKIY